jgi:predicted molibdopterin-dependent oxidoreductase YjgC
VLAELSLALGHDSSVTSQPSAFEALTEAVPFYSGITDAEIGGRGIRWQDRPAASSLPMPGAEGPSGPDSADATPRSSGVGSAEPDGAARRLSGEAGPSAQFALGTYRDLWAGPITELNPPLRFLAPGQRVEMSPADAESLELTNGTEVTVSQNGTSVLARVDVKERTPDGSVFLIEGTRDGNANALLNGGPVTVTIEKAAGR